MQLLKKAILKAYDFHACQNYLFFYIIQGRVSPSFAYEVFLELNKASMVL